MMHAARGIELLPARWSNEHGDIGSESYRILIATYLYNEAKQYSVEGVHFALHDLQSMPANSHPSRSLDGLLSATLMVACFKAE